ncbi:MAG: hypothetical protein PHD60_06090 [Clostridia bacterium]|nr:hypothetical protein [Clostridia bacterium]
MDVGSQMLIGGKSFSEVDWQSVGVSALEGAISGAIATATLGASLAVTAGREGLKLTGKQIAKQAGKTMLIHGTSGMVINATSQAVVKGEVNASEVILSGVIDSVTGGIGRVLPHTGLGKAVKTFGDNVAEKAKGFTRGAFDNTRLVLGNERGSVGGNVRRNVDAGMDKVAEQNYVLFNKTHKNSAPVLKGTGPNGGRLQSHHGLQQQWAKENIGTYGYDPALAPTVTIETGKGYPHTAITDAQTARRNTRVANGTGKWSSTLQEELQYIVDDFTNAGFSSSTIDEVLEQQYKMLDKLNIPYERIK